MCSCFIIFCAETVKICAAASKYISCSLRNVWLLLAVSQCFLKNVRLLLKDINEQLLLKENVQLIFACACVCVCVCVRVCVAASTNISIFFNERAAASKKILTTASEIY